jgi:hypothetical protein
LVKGRTNVLIKSRRSQSQDFFVLTNGEENELLPLPTACPTLRELAPRPCVHLTSRKA